jgi:hypothetical protein
MLRPAVDAEVDGISQSDWLRGTPSILPDHVQERAAPFVVGQEPVQIAPYRTALAPAHFSASAEQQRLTTARGPAAPMVNFIAHQRSAEHRPGADTAVLLGPFLGLKHGPDRQQPQPRPPRRHDTLAHVRRRAKHGQGGLHGDTPLAREDTLSTASSVEIAKSDNKSMPGCYGPPIVSLGGLPQRSSKIIWFIGSCAAHPRR